MLLEYALEEWALVVRVLAGREEAPEEWASRSHGRVMFALVSEMASQLEVEQSCRESTRSGGGGSSSRSASGSRRRPTSSQRRPTSSQRSTRRGSLTRMSVTRGLRSALDTADNSPRIWAYLPWLLAGLLIVASNVLTFWIALSIFYECDHLISAWFGSISVAIFLDWFVWDTISIPAKVYLRPYIESKCKRGGSSAEGRYKIGKKMLMGAMMRSPWLKDSLTHSANHEGKKAIDI